MGTIASRAIRSTPHRDAHATWTFIVQLLTQGRSGTARDQLVAVSGIAASLIADQAPRSAPIIVTCTGPRTRIYCVYNDDAVAVADGGEEPLGFDPLHGDWHVSLPCDQDDVAWVQGALKEHGTRITARDSDTYLTLDEEETPEEEALTIDPAGFLGT